MIERQKKHTKSFDEIYEIIREYIEINKKIPVRSTVYKNINFGTWINHMRNNYKKGKLSEDKIDKLMNTKYVVISLAPVTSVSMGLMA